MIIIGSRALTHMLTLHGRVTEKTDYDVIMSVEEFMEWQDKYKSYIVSLFPRSANKYKAIVRKNGLKVQYEIELGLEGTSSRFLLDRKGKVCATVGFGFLGEKLGILSLKYQLLTKRSHLIYPIHFEKNVSDYHFLKSVLGDFPQDETMQEYYKLRYDEAATRNKQRTPKLNVTTEDFFSSKLAVPNYFVHDHIHEMMAHDGVPMYTKMQPDPKMAWCSKDMFFNLSHKEQVQCVQEEAYTIALERYIIPQYGEKCNDFFDCYKRALKRICTTLCSGWFRDFAIENYNKAIEWYDPMFAYKFVHSVTMGKISPQDPHKLSDVPLFRG